MDRRPETFTQAGSSTEVDTRTAAGFLTDEDVARVRRHAAEIERRGELTPEVLELIYDQRLFKLFVPEELGGRLMDLPDALRLFEQASWVDGNFGWLVTIGSGGGYFVNYISPALLERVFGAREAVIAGSGRPGGTATPVAGGYRVNGTWTYCSGALHATVFTAGVLVGRVLRAFAFFPEEVTVHPDWDTVGLRGTSGHSFSVKDVFVPAERMFDLTRPHGRYNHAIYRYPFLAFAEASFAAVVLGIAGHFFDEAAAVLERRRAERAARQTLTARQRAAGGAEGPHALAQAALADARRTLAQRREAFYQAVERSWASCVSNGAPTQAEERAVGRESRVAAALVTERADALLPFLGMEGITMNSTINRIWRDLHTARQHAALVPAGELDAGEGA